MENLPQIEYHEYEFGTIYTVEEFIQDVEAGCLIDYDGHGNFAIKTTDGILWVSNLVCQPSDITLNKTWLAITWYSKFTHIIWYNR